MLKLVYDGYEQKYGGTYSSDFLWNRMFNMQV